MRFLTNRFSMLSKIVGRDLSTLQSGNWQDMLSITERLHQPTTYAIYIEKNRTY